MIRCCDIFLDGKKKLKHMDQIIQLTINKRPMDHIAHLRMFHVKSYQYVVADKEKKLISFLRKEWFFICKKMKINWIPITQRRFLPCVVKKIDEVVLKKLFNAFKIFSASRYALHYGNGFSPTYRKNPFTQ